MPLDDGPASLADDLHLRLSGITFPLTTRVESDIRERLGAYVDQLKELNLPPERIIVAVKRLANDAGIRSTSRRVATRASLDGADKLLVDMVGWCIERVYARRGAE